MKTGKTAQVMIEGEVKTMRIGDIVKIRECTPMPEVVGESAEIVDMQIQEFEKYAVFPVWVKMTSGERKGKTYGFQYDEVEVLPGAQVLKAKLAEIYGFQYNEVEVLPKAYEAQYASKDKKGGTETMKTKVVAQVEELLSGVTTVEDIAAIENAINEAKGKVLMEPAQGFWEEKTPCWEMFRCPEAMRKECPAFKYRTLPCWQIEGTYCKLFDYGERGDGTEICENCRVYKKWGHGEQIEIKLHGQGFDTIPKETLK